MGSKLKVDPDLLRRWCDQGKTMTWMAKQFGCSVQAVSAQVKRMNEAKAKYLVEDGLRPVVEHKVDAIQQLTKVNRAANKLLDTLERWADGDEGAIQLLESQVRRVNIGTRAEPQFMEVAQMKDPRELMVKVMGEIRMQMTAALDIQKTLWQVEDVKAVLDGIIGIIQVHVSPEVQKLIADEVKKHRSLRLEVGR